MRAPPAWSSRSSPWSRHGSSPSSARTGGSEATIKVHIGDQRIVATAEGNGPVNALDAALRQAIGAHYPALAGVHLTESPENIIQASWQALSDSVVYGLLHAENQD